MPCREDRQCPRTVFIQPEAGVAEVPFAVTRVARVTSPSWPMLSCLCSRPTAKTGSAFGAMLADTAIPILKRTTVLGFQAIEESSMRMVLSCDHKHRRLRQAYQCCRTISAMTQVMLRGRENSDGIVWVVGSVCHVGKEASGLREIRVAYLLLRHHLDSVPGMLIFRSRVN